MWGDSKFSIAAQRDVHRTRSTNVSAPALTWHTAFYMPNGVREGKTSADRLTNESITAESGERPIDKPNFDKDQNLLRRELDCFFVDFCNGLSQDNTISNIVIYPNLNDRIILFNDVYRRSAEKYVIEDPLRSAVQDQHLDCDRIHGDYPVVRIKFCRDGVPTELRCEIFTEYFTFTIYANDVLNNPVCASHVKQLKDIAQNGGSSESKQQIGNYFYSQYWEDFHKNIITNYDNIANYGDSFAFRSVFADFRGLILPIFEELDAKNTMGMSKHSQWDSDLLENLLDFMTDKNNFECAVSNMLGRKVLYMSDLGQRRLGPDTHRIPVTFLACLKGVDHGEQQASQFFVNKWQLGRLVDRLHFLGTVRLAALRDLSSIRSASRSLSEFEPLLKDAHDGMTSATVKQAMDHFYAIGRGFLSEDSTKHGLQYRIERSRYYASRFRQNIKLLRIVRFEGYQSYDQFVERRIGSIFDDIDRVGVRYDRAVSALSSLNQANTARISLQTEKNLENIQEWADLALIGFLIPYYTQQLLTHIVPKSACQMNGLFLIMWIAAYIVAVFRFLGIPKRSIIGQRLRMIVLVGSFLLLITSALIATGNLGSFLSEPISAMGWPPQSCKSESVPAHALQHDQPSGH